MPAGVARLAEAGVRFIGPLWERDSKAGTSCRTPAKRDHGLTEHGRALVRACNEAGLLLDVAHASRKTFWDMLEVSAHAAVFLALGRGRRPPAPAQPRRRSDPRAGRARRHRGRHLRGRVPGRRVLHARARRRPHRTRGARRRRRLRGARLGFRRVHAAAARAARRRRSAAADRAPVAARLARAAARASCWAATRSATWRKAEFAWRSGGLCPTRARRRMFGGSAGPALRG